MIGKKKKEQRKSQLFSQSRTGRRESNHRKSMIVGEEEKKNQGKDLCMLCLTRSLVCLGGYMSIELRMKGDLVSFTQMALDFGACLGSHMHQRL